MNKIATTPEQSKRLIELDLGIDTSAYSFMYTSSMTFIKPTISQLKISKNLEKSIIYE